MLGIFIGTGSYGSIGYYSWMLLVVPFSLIPTFFLKKLEGDYYGSDVVSLRMW
jgi:hypothetical protein